jgi:hypothetical protein
MNGMPACAEAITANCISDMQPKVTERGSNNGFSMQ